MEGGVQSEIRGKLSWKGLKMDVEPELNSSMFRRAQSGHFKKPHLDLRICRNRGATEVHVGSLQSRKSIFG